MIKEGDKVRIIHNSWRGHWKVGEIATVAQVRTRDRGAEVEVFGKHKERGDIIHQDYKLSDVELVTKEKKVQKKKVSFKDVVTKMKPSQIIMAMVKGLKAEHVKVDMGTFGSTSNEGKKEVCYGCAATNTICEIAGVKPTARMMKFQPTFAQRRKLGFTDFDYPVGLNGSLAMKTANAKEEMDFLDRFEGAIDELREGRIDRYNDFAVDNDMDIIVCPSEVKLPVMNTYDYKAKLPFYEALAKFNRAFERNEIDRLGGELRD